MLFEVVVVKLKAGGTRCLYLVNGITVVNDYDEGSEEFDFMFGQIARHLGAELQDAGVVDEDDFWVRWPLNEKVEL